MKVHKGSETILVTGSERNFEFRIHEEELEPISSDVPSEVFDIVERETTYDVKRPDEPRDFESLRFSGPYEGNEAASVLDFDAEEEKFDSLLGLMRYGIDVSVRVHPDGKTELYEINGKNLSDSITVS